MDIKINDSDKITMTHTGLLPGKKGKVIHVCFERKSIQEALMRGNWHSFSYT